MFNMNEYQLQVYNHLWPSDTSTYPNKAKKKILFSPKDKCWSNERQVQMINTRLCPGFVRATLKEKKRCKGSFLKLLFQFGLFHLWTQLELVGAKRSNCMTPKLTDYHIHQIIPNTVRKDDQMTCEHFPQHLRAWRSVMEAWLRVWSHKSSRSFAILKY